MNIYLDIDGVLLANSSHAAQYADEFLQLVLTAWPDTTYWLTTHQWRGQNRAVDVLRPVLKPQTVRLLDQVQPTVWDELKTDAINFKQPFLWFDDDLFPEEAEILAHYSATDCFRHINLARDPLQLLDEIEYLKSLA